jgi:hypothetical protein
VHVSPQTAHNFDEPPFGRDPAGSAGGQAVGSILVADCGSSFTRVSLLERVETGYCFVAHATAPTTVEPPWSDVSIGVRHAIEQITDVTGRPLLDDKGTLILPEAEREGVDLFIVTSSAGQPLRVVLAGLVSQVSLASLERAAVSSYVQVVGVIARDYVGVPRALAGGAGESEHRVANAYSANGSTARPRWSESGLDKAGASLADEEKINIIRQRHPDVVWVAGGTDGGSREPVRDLVETVALACTLVDRPPRPTIVYAGNTELRSEIVELIGEEVELDVISNVRPTLDVENLAAAQAGFQSAYVQRKLQRLPGIGSLIGWSSAPVLSTAQALGYLVMYLERLYESGKGVLCADVGSATTTVAASFPARPSVLPTGSASSPEAIGSAQPSLQVITDLGVGYGAPSLLEWVGVETIARWLPFKPEPGEVEAVLLNKGLRPTTIPQDRRQLLIEQAAVREALRLAMSRARESWWRGSSERVADSDAIGSRRWLTPPLEPIIATGGALSQAPRPGQAALMLLDAIEPVGITTMVLDEPGVASALGAVAVTQPPAAVQALDAGAFPTLGTVVSPVGRARPGEVIMRVKVAFDQRGELDVEVKYGSLEVLPLRMGEKARLELKPRRGISVGKIAGAVEVHGGAVGLIIDARGRPLRLPSNPAVCRRQMQRWLWDVGA